MARDTQYPRGAGSPPIPEDALTQLKSDLQTLNNINNKAIQSGLTSVQTGAGVAVYEDILQLVATSETVTDPDTGMSQTDWTPDPNVAANVVAWLVGAIGVNSDSTFGGAFIRDYTADQIMLRSGSDAPPTSQLNNLASLASNLIAASVGADVVLYGDVPDIVGLATYDAGNVAATAFSTALYSSGYYPGSVTTGGAGGQASFTGGDYAAWAGSLLFSYLGDSGVYEDWILNSNTFSLNGVTYKNTTGSYDLISSIIAATEAGFQAAVPFHIGGALEAYLIGPAGATANPVGLIAETNAWFSGYYFLPSNNGYTGGEFLPGPNTVFAGNITTTVDYVLGTLASDSQLDETANTSNVISVGDEIGTTLYEPAMIVGGPNDDVIHGFADGDELIDGGDGNNTIYAGGGQSIIYGGGAGNNTIYGNSQDTSLSGNLFGTIDLLVGGGGDGIAANNAIDAPDPTLQPPADGTDTFYLQDDTDIVVGGDGKNVFNIDDTNFSPYLDIIWGGGGASNYNFTISPGGRHSSVLIVHMDNPSLTKVLGLSATAIESLVQSDGLGAGTIVMIDPTSNDTISLNGKVLQGAGYSDTVSPNGYSGLLDYVDANDIAYIPGFGYPSNGNFPSTPANALTVGTVQNGAGVSFATQTYVAPLLNVANFVDGDFGITLNPVSPVQGPYGGTSPYGDVDYYSDFHQLFAVNPLFFSDTSQQTISVGSTGDTLSGDNGNNFLTGTGNVTYDIDQGDGLVTVASASDPNTGEGGIIALDSSFSPDTVSVSAGGPNGTYSDIIIQDSAGDGVDLASALSSSASPISQVEFSDGTVWSYAQLLSIIAAEHVIDSHGTSTYETGKGDGDTFIYNQGYGQLSIFVSQYLNDVNILSFGAGISASQVAVKGDASGDIVLTDGVVGDQVVLQDMLYGTGYGVESVQFADGTTWTAAQIIAQSLVGTTGADTLYGTTALTYSTARERQRGRKTMNKATAGQTPSFSTRATASLRSTSMATSPTQAHCFSARGWLGSNCSSKRIAPETSISPMAPRATGLSSIAISPQRSMMVMDLKPSRLRTDQA